jgi:hypothetical protein
VLSELNARVFEYIKLINKRIVKKKGAFAVKYALQETITLLILIKLKFLAKVKKILVQVLKSYLKYKYLISFKLN